MSTCTEYFLPPRKTVNVAEVLFRIALFYSVSTLIVGLSSLVEAPRVAAYDDLLALLLAQDGTLFLLMSAWFGALAFFFRHRPMGLTFPAGVAQMFLFLQFALFAGAMWPLQPN